MAKIKTGWKIHKGKLLRKVENYPIGTIFEYWINKVYEDNTWTGEFDYIGRFKSTETESGFHTLLIFKEDVKELT